VDVTPASASRVVVACVVALLACGAITASASAFSLTADPFVQQGSKLVAEGVSEFAEQGASVAISADGNTAIVGSPAYNGFTGAAWIYVRSGSTWTQQAKLVSKEASGNVHLGYSVALSADGNTALIGGKTYETGKGAAWLFTRSGSTWTERAKLVGSEASDNAEQGSSVALSGDGKTALVGGYIDSGGVGATWAFTGSGSSWSQQGKKLVGAHGSGVVEQGTSVALSGDGNTALIGGPFAENEKGDVWVFTRAGSTWKEQGKLPAGTGAGEDTAQGQSVALSADGDTALVGGPGQEEATGAAWVFTRSDEAWNQQGGELLGEDAIYREAQEGHSVALSEDGNTALIGGYHDDVSVGAAWAFVRSGSTWGEQEKLVGTGSAGGFSTQGSSVALSATGTTALVGGAGDNGEVGATWVFASNGEAKPPEEPTKEPTSSTGSTTSTTSSSSTAASGSAPATVAASGSSPAGIATTPRAVEALELGCSKRALVLNDVVMRGGRVVLEGSAAKTLDGRRVKIVFDGSEQVATATVGANGEFSTTAMLPPAALRDSNSARYMAESGSQRSLDLKLTRRVVLEPPTFSGGTVTLVGQVLPPLTKPVAAVTVQQELECGRVTTVGSFKPSSNGRFHIAVKVPGAARAGIYRLSSGVAEKLGSKQGFATFSLPLPVILG
jgi:FG-GAP repeat